MSSFFFDRNEILYVLFNLLLKVRLKPLVKDQLNQVNGSAFKPRNQIFPFQFFPFFVGKLKLRQKKDIERNFRENVFGHGWLFHVKPRKNLTLGGQKPQLYVLEAFV